MNAQQFPCKNCGANLAFEPGTRVQKCDYCGFENPIIESLEPIEELDYATYLNYVTRVEKAGSRAAKTEDRIAHCNTCGADISLPEHTSADACAYCGSSVVMEETNRVITPQSLLPFGFDGQKARGLFKQWLASRWFAPGDFKRKAMAASGLQGIYVPYWTFDSQTTTDYRGERGDNYFEIEPYTEIVNGEMVTRTRQVVRIRWRMVGGRVRRFFDDVLVLGSRTLPRKLTEALEPWELNQLVAYDEKYLSGFRAEKYQVGLRPGFANAHQIMEGKIRRDIGRDIGGDHQRIHSLDIRHGHIRFKHILLPIWVSAYRYRKKVYRFLVNGRSGEIQGERPFSVAKILLTALLGAALISAIYYAANYF